MKLSEFKNSVDREKSREGESNARALNLEIILNVVKKINSSLILDDVLKLVLENAIKLTSSERGFIVLKDKEGHLEFKLGLDNKGSNLTEDLFNYSTTVVEDVFKTGQSKFIESALSDTNHDPSKSILKLELQTILCSPLITDDKKIGVIYVDSRILHKVREKEITDTYEILAGQAATAIRNAQLYKGQLSAYNALNEANVQLIQVERKALKSSIDAETGQSLQGLVHVGLLEAESLVRIIEKSRKELEEKYNDFDTLLFDRLKLKTKIAIDSIRSIQKYAQVLMETSVMNMNKDEGDINKTIQSVIKYLSPMKKFGHVEFVSELNAVPMVKYDSEQLQHLLVHIFNNAVEAKHNAEIHIKSYFDKNRVFVEIADNGPGYPEDKVDLLFEIPSPKKTGYGLFLCKSIIDRHNGQIRVLPARGASLQFSIPV